MPVPRETEDQSLAARVIARRIVLMLLHLLCKLYISPAFLKSFRDGPLAGFPIGFGDTSEGIKR